MPTYSAGAELLRTADVVVSARHLSRYDRSASSQPVSVDIVVLVRDGEDCGMTAL